MILANRVALYVFTFSRTYFCGFCNHLWWKCCVKSRLNLSHSQRLSLSIPINIAMIEKNNNRVVHDGKAFFSFPFPSSPELFISPLNNYYTSVLFKTPSSNSKFWLFYVCICSWLGKTFHRKNHYPMDIWLVLMYISLDSAFSKQPGPGVCMMILVILYWYDFTFVSVLLRMARPSSRLLPLARSSSSVCVARPRFLFCHPNCIMVQHPGQLCPRWCQWQRACLISPLASWDAGEETPS